MYIAFCLSVINESMDGRMNFDLNKLTVTKTLLMFTMSQGQLQIMLGPCDATYLVELY